MAGRGGEGRREGEGRPPNVSEALTPLHLALYLLTYALSLPVKHRPRATFLHPFLSLATASIFLLQLYLNPVVPISDSRSLWVFLGLPLLLWLGNDHAGAYFAMQSSYLKWSTRNLV